MEQSDSAVGGGAVQSEGRAEYKSRARSKGDNEQLSGDGAWQWRSQ